jgi:metal-sulfur cluster biosynthetic enzyme
VRSIVDPELPNTLEELNVLSPDSIDINHSKKRINITFLPTIPGCTLCMVIGLCIIQRLSTSIPPYYKIHVSVAPGSHDDEESVNKQLADKERVAAATENPR